MGWAKIPQLAKHLGLSVRTTRELVRAEVIPITRLPSGTVIANLDLVDEALVDRGDEVAMRQQQIINKCLEGLK